MPNRLHRQNLGVRALSTRQEAHSRRVRRALRIASRKEVPRVALEARSSCVTDGVIYIDYTAKRLELHLVRLDALEHEIESSRRVCPVRARRTAMMSGRVASASCTGPRRRDKRGRPDRRTLRLRCASWLLTGAAATVSSGLRRRSHQTKGSRFPCGFPSVPPCLQQLA